MPEKVGTVTGLIKKRDGAVFGLNIDGSEYLYSFLEYRGEPFEEDIVEVGCEVRVEYQDTEKAGKAKSYISVLEVGLGGEGPRPESPQAAPAARETAYEMRDRLSLMQTCINAGTTKWRASLEAAVGMYELRRDQTHAPATVGADELNAFAAAIAERKAEPLAQQLYAWALQAVTPPADIPGDEVPFE